MLVAPFSPRSVAAQTSDVQPSESQAAPALEACHPERACSVELIDQARELRAIAAALEATADELVAAPRPSCAALRRGLATLNAQAFALAQATRSTARVLRSAEQEQYR